MSDPECKTVLFYPYFSDWNEDGVQYPLGWRAASTDRPGCTWVFDDRDCMFGSREDCVLACKSLQDSGLNGDQLELLSDDEFGKLVTRYLRW